MVLAVVCRQPLKTASCNFKKACYNKVSNKKASNKKIILKLLNKILAIKKIICYNSVSNIKGVIFISYKLLTIS